MYLAQRITQEDLGGTDCFYIRVLNCNYPNMVALKKDMRKHPEKFNEGEEYGLWEPKPFLKCETQKINKVVQSQNEPFYKKE